MSPRPPHQFDPDATRDYWDRSWCRWCGLPGEPGDERHPAGAPGRYPEQSPEARELALRVLGEHDDETE